MKRRTTLNPTRKQTKDVHRIGTLDKEQLVVQYAPLVKRIAYHLMAKLPASVQVEDIIQNGMLSARRHQPLRKEGLGAQFETHAAQRIRGSMLDGLRENDWLPRSTAPRYMRRIRVARCICSNNGTAVHPPRAELADSLGMCR